MPPSALVKPENAVNVMGNQEHMLIAQEMVQTLKKEVRVDWAKREQVSARILTTEQDILADHGYPPGLSTEAVKIALQQTEAISSRWGKNVDKECQPKLRLNQSTSAMDCLLRPTPFSN